MTPGRYNIKVYQGSTVGTTDGKFTLALTAAETTALAAGNYVYDLEVTSPGGVVTRLLEGGFIVYEGVTS
jgi:hypothetical protein